MQMRKQRPLLFSKLDNHKGFVLGLIEDMPDINDYNKSKQLGQSSNWGTHREQE